MVSRDEAESLTNSGCMNDCPVDQYELPVREQQSVWRPILIGNPFGFLVSMQFEPHRVEDRETAGETDSEDPAEVPHDRFTPGNVHYKGQQ